MTEEESVRHVLKRLILRIYSENVIYFVRCIQLFLVEKIQLCFNVTLVLNMQK